MELAEAVAFAQLDSPIRKCPFEEQEAEELEEEDEHVTNDDTVAVHAAQENDGGILGNNVIDGSPGASKTWNTLGADPPRYQAPREDTGRTGASVKVKGDSKPSPFTVAAHHLIPGNAALYDSSLFKSYIRKNGKMTVKEPTRMTFTLAEHIGYNVNGSHNGVWLPGSYAIRADVHPSKLTWSALIASRAHADWCYDYMAAVTKKAGGQFHDTHTEYSNRVGECLEKLSLRLQKHQQLCEDCQSKDKVPPPYSIKAKLYRLSQYLRLKTLAGPRRWKDPWFTSDQVRSDVMGDRKRKAAFLRAYRSAAR